MIAFLRACGVPEEELDAWRYAWDRISDLDQARKNPAAILAETDLDTERMSVQAPPVADSHLTARVSLATDNKGPRSRLVATTAEVGDPPIPVREAGESVTRSPLVARRELGVLLRALRGAKGITVKQVAEYLKCSLDTVYRMEADFGADEKDIYNLCRLYDVDPTQGRTLMDLAYAGSRQGWWERYDVPYKTYIEYENGAASIKTFSCAVVPGLLQTRDYARAMNLSTVPKLAVEDVERGVEVRLNRQRILHRADPPHCWLILDEAALRREVGGPDMMRHQLNHLTEVAKLPNVTLQVIPFTAGLHAAMDRSFIVLEFANPILDVAYTESLFSPSNFSVTDLYVRVFDELSSCALSEEESIAFIERIAG
jgi:transcriptional regulator with XRE-family HTH domain